MNKKDYLTIKRYLKTLCLDSVKELCDNTGLSDMEIKLIIDLYNDSTRAGMCIKYNCCESKIYKDLKRAVAKINDYMKRNNLSIK